MAVLAALLPFLNEPVGAQPGPDPVSADDIGPGDVGMVDELVGERTVDSKTYSTDADGVFVTEVFAEPVSFVDEASGALVDIDTTLQDTGVGTVESAATPVDVEIGLSGDDPDLVTITLEDDQVVSFGLEAAAPAGGVVGGDTVVFDDILADTSLELEVTPAGVKESIVLDSVDAPSVYRFGLSVEGLRVELDDEFGHVWFFDDDAAAGDDPVGLIPAGFMVDANWENPAFAQDQAYSEGVDYALETDAAGSLTLVVSVDEVWLAAPGRAWPVVVDPTWATYDADDDDTYVTPYVTTDRSTLNYFYSGSLGTFNNYPYLRMDTSGVTGKVIHYAQLTALQTGGTACTETGTALHRVTELWDGLGLVWINKPAIDATPVASAASAMGGTGCGSAQWVTWGLTDTVRNWADATWVNNGLSMRADAPLDPANWKKFASGNNINPPAMQIYWSEPGAASIPDVPTNLAPAGIVGQLAALSATYADPEGDAGYVKFVVYDDVTNAPAGIVDGNTVASGGTSSYTPQPGEEAVPDRVYRVEAWAVDSVNGGWSATAATVTNTVSSFTLDQPAYGSTVFDTETLIASNPGGYLIDQVDFVVDGVVVASDTDGTNGWTTTWDTTTETDGPHTVQAIAIDGTTSYPTALTPVGVTQLIGGADRVQADFDAGKLTLDEWAFATTQVLAQSPALAARYMPTPGAPVPGGRSGLTGALTEVMLSFDDLSAATQASILAEFDTPEVPTGTTSPTTTSTLPPDPGCGQSLVAQGEFLGQDGPWCYNEFTVAHSEAPKIGIYYKVTAADPLDLVDATADADGNGIPDQIDSIAATFDAAWTTYLNQGYELLAGSSDLVKVGVFDHGLDPFGRAKLGQASGYFSDDSWIGIDPEADANSVAHEAFHLPYQRVIFDTRGLDGPTRTWFMESTAVFAESYYASIPTTALNAYASGPQPDWRPNWLNGLRVLDARPGFWEDPSDPLAAGRPWGLATNSDFKTENYEAAIFWQYLAERYSTPTVTGDDILRDALDEIESRPDGETDLMDVIDTVTADPIEDLLRDFWPAIHILENQNFDTPELNWTLPSSDPGEWVAVLDAEGTVAVQSDAFGAARASSVQLDVDDGETKNWSVKIYPGGARFIDVTRGGTIARDLEITVDQTAGSGSLAVTAVAYDAVGHPRICVRDPGGPDESVEMVQWTEPAGVQTLRIDSACRTASIVLVNTDPLRSAEVIEADIEIFVSDAV